MDFSKETKDSIKRDLSKRENVIVDMIPVYVSIDGMNIDIDSEDRGGGEVTLFLGTPLFCSDNDKYYNLVEVKKEDI